MSQLLSKTATSEVIAQIERALELTLYTKLPASQVSMVREYLKDLRGITDNFTIKVDFTTNPAIRQTVVAFILTPVTGGLQ